MWKPRGAPVLISGFVVVLAFGVNVCPGHAWVTEVIDTSEAGGEGGECPSVAVDAAGNLHISSINETLACLQYSTNASGAWKTLLLDVAGGGGCQTSIALDSAGKAHISYHGPADLRYATNASGSWETTVVDNAGSVGRYASIAVDGSDRVHISYYDGSNKDLKYATNASGSWQAETVDAGLDVGYYTSIALDTADHVHIAYYDQASDDLEYATNRSGQWDLTTVDADGQVGWSPSIVVDSSDHVHISYGAYQVLKYATNASGDWVIEEADPAPHQSGLTSIALDSQENVHISYRHYFYENDQGRNDLVYVTNASGDWTSVTVVGSEEQVEGNDIVLDPLDHVHIGYFDKVNRLLRHATNASGVWSTATVESPGEFQYVSLAADGQARLYVSYYDEGMGDLKYATNASGTWVAEAVDTEGIVGFRPSIALDSASAAHISYYDAENGYLKYATNASGAWVPEVLDAERYAGYYSDIALDASSHVHISYSSNNGLQYATNASGAWVITTVDPGFNIYTANSIAVDGGGKVHIGYFDVGGLALRYASNASGTWEPLTIYVADRSLSSSMDLALDSSDRVYIGFTESSSVKAATNAPGGQWRVAYVGGGLNPSLAVDASDVAHMAFYWKSKRFLQYANNALGTWVSETACDRTEKCGDYPSIAMVGTDGIFICHQGGDATLLLTTGPPLPCRDLDGDQFGYPATTLCAHPEWDCDDDNPSVNPGVFEFPGNGIDDDCDGQIDEWTTPSVTASTYGVDSADRSSLVNRLAILLIPLGIIVFLRLLRVKR